MLAESSQHRARRRAVTRAFRYFQRQTNQFVITRRHFRKVQPFNNDDAILEQRQVRSMMAGMKLLNGKIIRADKFYAATYQDLCGFGKQMRVIVPKTFVPKARVARAKQEAFDII